MAARRAVQAKALANGIGSPATLSAQQANRAAGGARIKSTSMTNLVASSGEPNGQQANRPIQRPASRNALDSIHKGMNAKFTHVQSKVLLQNIRPQGGGSKIPASSSGTLTRNQNGARPSKPHTAVGTAQSAALGPGKIQQSDRSQLINKIKALQEELGKQEELREELKQELEREKGDKQEQLGQIKLEMEEKARESERQNEDYHQKLLEAYELADQNRRAADSVLSESRQREDELRKKIDELELQLVELKEFVSMKEEMQSKMGELREQIRAERERYEEKTRNLNQMFETEKISPHMRVDQNSNYFKRARGSLQSSESINRLDGREAAESGGQEAGGAEPASRQHRSQNDIYGSKLSTRMQDGAKFAWKKSRKFASSVITGSLGGISACRKRDRKSQPNCFEPEPSAQNAFVGANSHEVNLQVMGAHVARGGAIEVTPRDIIVTQQPHVFQQEVNEQHTSVIEVGEQQPLQHASARLTEPELQQHQQSEHQQQASASMQQLEERKQQISVDENNKLTIVTKFNGDPADQQPAASSASNSGSERSRCESSSSGRGTSSDCGSATSQNGDAERPKTPSKSLSEADPTASGASNTSSEHQRQHKRRSSLFKASEVLSGSQASLNKTLKSLFARKTSALAASEDESVRAQVARRTHHSFDQDAVPFDLASKTAFQEVPRLETFKQMRELARDKPSQQTEAARTISNGSSSSNMICVAVMGGAGAVESGAKCELTPSSAHFVDAGHSSPLAVVEAGGF